MNTAIKTPRNTGGASQHKGHGFRKQSTARAADFLPDPETLEAYDYVIEGSAQVIMNMIEREQKHRHHLEKRALAIQATGLYFGQVVAGFVAGGLLLSITVLGLSDQFTLAMGVAILGIGGMTAGYVKGREATAARFASYRKTRSDANDALKASNQA